MKKEDFIKKFSKIEYTFEDWLKKQNLKEVITKEYKWKEFVLDEEFVLAKFNEDKNKKIKELLKNSKPLTEEEVNELRNKGKRYSFKERTPKIGDYISMFWNDGSDCECIFTGIDENTTPLPDGWYHVD